MTFRRYVLLLLGLLLTLGWRHARGQERPPNVLIAISDDQSYPHASAYGSTMVSTPSFDRVAAGGVLFTNAISASPGCSPSRAALLTGRYPWQLEEAGTHGSSFPRRYVVFPDLLEGSGYHVGYTGKGWGPGDWEISGRTRNPAGPSHDTHRLTPPHGGISTLDYAANFAEFLRSRSEGQPFYFWYGASEPHRVFEEGAGLKAGKDLADADVPGFLPDVPIVRADLLDYALEIEWFDHHLGLMLAMLEEAGELDNTIVIVTSDNGMAFPRAKANGYEPGIHVPLAVQWPARALKARVVDDLVSLIDLAPTILEAAGVTHPEDAPPMGGSSLLNILESNVAGTVDTRRDAVYSARERHSSSRYDNLGYPQRILRTRQYLYIRNFAPERWPAGAPRRIDGGGDLGPMHGAYHDIDACPSLDFLVAHRTEPDVQKFLHLAVEQRPAEELFDLRSDPHNLRNLTLEPAYEQVTADHRDRLNSYLTETRDPRMLGNGDIFETYPRLRGSVRSFPPPDWALPVDR